MAAWTDRVRWGVIDDARRRQRRHRFVGGVAAAILACGLAASLAIESTVRPPRAPVPLRLSSSLTTLTGSALGTTHLRLVAAEGDDPPDLIDVDTRRVTPLPQLDIPGPPNLGPDLSLTPYRGGALAVVNHQACEHCTLTEEDYLIDAIGTVRRIAVRSFPAFIGTTERESIPGSTAEWVLRWPHRGPCTLRRVPSTRSAVEVPCGDLSLYRNEVVVGTTIVDPATGAVRGHVEATGDRLEPIGRELAISGPIAGAGELRLVNLVTGRRHVFRWPSDLQFSYRLFPDPAGPYVAIEFGDPAYPGYSVHVNRDQNTIGQAADLWLLNTHSARLTHVPGFPVLELLKGSGVAWSPDGRLVIAARGGSFAQSTTRTAIGVWRPGQPAVAVGTLPPLNGYTQLVPLDG